MRVWIIASSCLAISAVETLAQYPELMAQLGLGRCGIVTGGLCGFQAAPVEYR